MKITLTFPSHPMGMRIRARVNSGAPRDVGLCHKMADGQWCAILHADNGRGGTEDAFRVYAPAAPSLCIAVRGHLAEHGRWWT